jgi:hypothetical protein
MTNRTSRDMRRSRRPLRHFRGAMHGIWDKVSSRSDTGRDEAGAVLVLALLFLAAVGGIVGSLASWATNDLNNTAKFTSARTLQYAFNGATEVAIQNIRYTPLLATTAQGTPGSCWGTSSSLQIDNRNIDVWCSTVWRPTSASTRVVTLDACPHGGTASACVANPSLEAVVTFDDYPTGSSPPNPAACVAYCGTSMTVNSWVWSP